MSRRLLFAALLLAAPVAAQRAESDALVAPAEVTEADFFTPGLAPVRNGRGYDVTAVYFMDYACPSCRRYTPDVARVMREDRRVRWIYRDIPSISPHSTTAARVALAASFQGKHDAFHAALMTSKGQLTPEAIRAAGLRAGLDWARIDRDVRTRRAAIDRQLDRNAELASATGIDVTPAFIIGRSQSNGALDYKDLKAEIADARLAARRR
jgi:protein-disulfide isomerase